MRTKRFLAALLTLCILASFWVMPASATEFGLGPVTDSLTLTVGPGAVYRWYDVYGTAGATKIHALELDLMSSSLKLMLGRSNGNVIGMQTVSGMASDLEAKTGGTVIAGINGDFYSLQTGVPLSFLMENGEVVMSPLESGCAFTVTSDGRAFVGEYANIFSATAYINGESSSVNGVNRAVGADWEGLYLFTSAYGSTTRTTGGTEVICTVNSGRVANGETLLLTVDEIREDQGGAPLSEGKVVLSAMTDKRALLQSLTPGSQVMVSVALQNGYENATLSTGGAQMLVSNGEIIWGVTPDRAPRTVIGVTAEGRVLMFVVDGRATGFSAGATYNEAARLAYDLGCVSAMALDGGGSSTFLAQLPGAADSSVINRPSDGTPRKVGTGLLVLNTAAKGPAASLMVTPYVPRVLAGSTIQLTAAALDANILPVAANGTISWSGESQLGTIDANGLLTTTRDSKAGVVTASDSAGITGQRLVQVVTTPTSITPSKTSVTLGIGEKVSLSAKAAFNGYELASQTDAFTWSVQGDIGSFTAPGEFTAGGAGGATGKILVSAGGTTAEISVTITKAPTILLDFETEQPPMGSSASGGASSSIAYVTGGGENVRFGGGSLKLNYNFTGTTGAATAEARPKAIENNNILIDGYPKRIGLWVYGDGSGNTLTGEIADSTGKTAALNYTGNGGLSFTGWKYVEATVPSGLTEPLKLSVPAQVTQYGTMRGKSVVYIDNIRAVYSGTTTDGGIGPISYKDVSVGQWFYNEVQNMSRKGLMGETDTGMFSPELSLSRGMLVTILWRQQGSPAATQSAGYSDVAAGQWYEAAVNWASANGIVGGYDDGRYGPNDPITREQFVTILYRFESMRSGAPAATGDLSAYPDAEKLNTWSQDAMKWAVGKGIISGMDGLLAPAGKTTRAQTAVMLTRFLGA